MRRFETVIAYCPRGSQANVHKRSPSLQLVMTVMMEKKGSTDGNSRACGFDGRKSGVIVHDVIRKENLLSTAPAHVQG